MMMGKGMGKAAPKGKGMGNPFTAKTTINPKKTLNAPAGKGVAKGLSMTKAKMAKGGYVKGKSSCGPMKSGKK